MGETIIIALITALITGLVAFVFNSVVNNQKEISSINKNKYLEIKDYFLEIKKCLKTSDPKDYTSYINNKRVPLIEKLQASKENMRLNKKVIKKAKLLEGKCLYYGYVFYSYEQKIIDKTEELVKLHSKNLQFNGSYIVSNVSCGNFNITQAMQRKRYNSLLFDTDKNLNGYNIVCMQKSASINYISGNIYICKNSLKNNLTISELFDKVVLEVIPENEFSKLKNQRKKLFGELEKLIKTIDKRTIAPFTIWETIGGVIKEILRIK